MKKILLTLSILGATVLGLNTTKAAELDLNDVDTNTYIIGDRVYELNEYFLSIYDVVSATREYANNHDNELAPIYYVGEKGNGEKYLMEITGVAVDGVVPTKTRELETVFPDSLMHATALNNVPLDDFMGTAIEPKLIAAVNTLNAELNGSNYGFKAITYDAQTKTVVFDIEDYKASLVNYQNSSIVELFKANIVGAESVKYTVGNETLTLNKEDITNITEAQIKGIAAAILKSMSDDLTLGSVVGKTTSAEVTFVDNNGFTVSETYNVTFKYDVEKLKDEVIAEVVETLNSELATHPEYGFETITYDTETKTVDFEVKDIATSLVSYKDSSIADLFKENMKGAVNIVYTVGAENMTLNEEDIAGLTDTQIKGIAAAILKSMSDDLTLGSVIGKSTTATVTYADDTVITYKVQFSGNVEEIKDAEITEVVETLNTELTTHPEYGFESITYNTENNTVSFEVANIAASLVTYKDSEIVELFKSHIKGATTIVYTVGAENMTLTKEDIASLTDTQIKGIAAAILKSMSEDLTLGSVIGKSTTATVTFVDGSTVNYTVTFTGNVEEIKDTEITEVANTLNTELATHPEYGFKEITYSAETNTVNFEVANMDASLVTYKDSGIVELFKSHIKGATSIVYTVGTENMTLTKGDIAGLTDTQIKGIAAAILKSMSEDLTLGSVIGKSTTATVTYVDGSVVTYTVAFNGNVEEIKDVALTNVVNSLNSELASHPEYGFESITYNTDTNTVTFKVQNVDASLVAYKDSGVADLFMENIKGATNIVYTVGDQEMTLNEEDIAGLDNNEVKGIAAAILKSMSDDLTLGSVVNKNAQATVTYVDGNEVTYTVAFTA